MSARFVLLLQSGPAGRQVRVKDRDALRYAHRGQGSLLRIQPPQPVFGGR